MGLRSIATSIHDALTVRTKPTSTETAASQAQGAGVPPTTPTSRPGVEPALNLPIFDTRTGENLQQLRRKPGLSPLSGIQRRLSRKSSHFSLGGRTREDFLQDALQRKEQEAAVHYDVWKEFRHSDIDTVKPLLEPDQDTDQNRQSLTQRQKPPKHQEDVQRDNQTRFAQHQPESATHSLASIPKFEAHKQAVTQQQRGGQTVSAEQYQQFLSTLKSLQSTPEALVKAVTYEDQAVQTGHLPQPLEPLASSISPKPTPEGLVRAIKEVQNQRAEEGYLHFSRSDDHTIKRMSSDNAAPPVPYARLQEITVSVSTPTHLTYPVLR